MKIGILQTGHTHEALLSEHGDYDAMFVRLLGGHGFSFDTYPVVDGTFPEGPRAADAWLITGSRHGAYEDHPWIPPLEGFIRDAYAERVPLVGICFGHQIIAQALGGKVVKYSAGWAVGPQDYHFADGETVTVNAWHQDQVVERPKDAEPIANNAFCENAALVYGDRAWTFQPHPEFGAEFVSGLIEKRGRGVVPDNLLDAAQVALGRPTDSARIAQRIADFLKAPRNA